MQPKLPKDNHHIMGNVFCLGHVAMSFKRLVNCGHHIWIHEREAANLLTLFKMLYAVVS